MKKSTGKPPRKVGMKSFVSVKSIKEKFKKADLISLESQLYYRHVHASNILGSFIQLAVIDNGKATNVLYLHIRELEDMLTKIKKQKTVPLTIPV